MAIDKDDDLVPGDFESCLAQTGLQHLAVALCLIGWQVQALVDGACIDGCQLGGRLQCLGADVAVPGSTASNVHVTASFARPAFMVMRSQSRENRKKTRLAATC